ncbi:ATP synthase mitochondrial F1 complex assembly factor 1 [Rana temporaria]|uniref:ATP synthase mitochondrial F1 complex assembly factor 1 n=1 Tax=Rana temporaria TaxID=8407 RepID=UPI001AAD1523|nr:ATP synthase mitochondrial F1 complex assembly factor 1 [Rana temporaria]
MWREGEMAAALVQMSLGFRGFLAVRSRAGGPGPLGGLWQQMRVFSVDENPFYNKYRRKIEDLRRSDPDVYETRMEKRAEVTSRPLGASRQAEFARRVEERVGSPRGNFTRNKTLNSVLNLDLVRERSAEEINQIWKEFFSVKDAVYAVIPGETFDVIWTRAQSCPAFLYAVPRAEGYEFYVGQWSGTALHFTSLINIQSAGDAAPSQLIFHHYTDLQKEKGIVLMNSEMDSTFLSVPEAQCLANQVQLFYGGEWFHLVESFNHTPDNFKYMSVVSALEQSGLGKAAHQT